MEFFRGPGFVLLVVIVATALFVADALRRRCAPALTTVATLAFASALTIFLLGLLHTGAVVAGAIAGRGVGNAPQFTYNFQFYSLLLVGFSLLVPALVVLLRARNLANGRRAAWKTVMWSNAVLLAVNGPMIPVQKFAILLGSLAAASLLLLGFTRGRFQSH